MARNWNQWVFRDVARLQTAYYLSRPAGRGIVSPLILVKGRDNIFPERKRLPLAWFLNGACRGCLTPYASARKTEPGIAGNPFSKVTDPRPGPLRMAELAEPFLCMVSTEPALPSSIIKCPLSATGRRPKQCAGFHDTRFHAPPPNLPIAWPAPSHGPRLIAQYDHPSRSPAQLEALPRFESK